MNARIAWGQEAFDRAMMAQVKPLVERYLAEHPMRFPPALTARWTLAPGFVEGEPWDGEL